MHKWILVLALAAPAFSQTGTISGKVVDALGDAADTHLYVSSVTGQVVLDTQRVERAWNWAGSVVHWIYPTALRKHWSAWDTTVWWLSLVAMIGAIVLTLRSRPGVRKQKISKQLARTPEQDEARRKLALAGFHGGEKPIDRACSSFITQDEHMISQVKLARTYAMSHNGAHPFR